MKSRANVWLTAASWNLLDINQLGINGPKQLSAFAMSSRSILCGSNTNYFSLLTTAQFYWWSQFCCSFNLFNLVEINYCSVVWKIFLRGYLTLIYLCKLFNLILENPTIKNNAECVCFPFDLKSHFTLRWSLICYYRCPFFAALFRALSDKSTSKLSALNLDSVRQLHVFTCKMVGGKALAIIEPIKQASFYGREP